MEILQFSKERGIFAIFNGYGKQAYIFHSEWYGVFGYADIMDEVGSDSITVEVYLGEFVSNFKSIIKRGITKCERRYIDDRKIDFNFHYLNSDGSGVTNSVFKYDNVLHVSTYDGIRECKY